MPFQFAVYRPGGNQYNTGLPDSVNEPMEMNETT